MKKFFSILSVLFFSVAAFQANAQLVMGDTEKGATKLTTIQAQWVYLYELGGHYYYVCNSTNQFDTPFWLDLGGSPLEAGKTIMQLYEALDKAQKDEQIPIESDGEKFTLSYQNILGTRTFIIHSNRGNRTVRAGTGHMEKSGLRKAYNYFREMVN